MFLAPSMAATVQLCSLKRGSKKDLLKMHGGVKTCLHLPMGGSEGNK